MLETILTKIGLPVLIALVGEALKNIDNPLTKGAADALDKVEEAMKAGQIAPEQIAEANRHAETLAQMKSDELRENIAEINKSLRAEIASEDKYVRRMRPTFGYLMALTWAAQMLGIAYVIIFDTSRSVLVLNAMGSLSAIWAVGLSVLGIYVYKRSEDKKLNPPEEVIYWN
ncbi:MAG: ribokinase [Alphaproteobacteria bacterium]|nr:ribokinase [Alphaproteobacteria bacterium]